MDAFRTIAAFVVSVAGAACAPYGGGAALPTSTGRYLQFKHPVSGVVGLQITFPTPEGCAGMLSTVRSNKEMLPYIACASAPTSPVLPARATVRNKTYVFLVDIEAVSLSECKSFVDSIMNSEGKENLELAAPCARR